MVDLCQISINISEKLFNQIHKYKYYDFSRDCVLLHESNIALILYDAICERTLNGHRENKIWLEVSIPKKVFDSSISQTKTMTKRLDAVIYEKEYNNLYLIEAKKFGANIRNQIDWDLDRLEQVMDSIQIKTIISHVNPVVYIINVGIRTYISPNIDASINEFLSDNSDKFMQIVRKNIDAPNDRITAIILALNEICV